MKTLEIKKLAADLKDSKYPSCSKDLEIMLIKLSDLCEIINSFAQQYDWSNIPYNGYRSLIKICDLFVINAVLPNFKYEHKAKPLIHLTNLLIEMVSAAIRYHKGIFEENKSDGTQMLLIKVFKEIKNHYDIIEGDLKYYWGYHALFWMDPSSRWIPYLFSIIFTSIAKLPKSLLASVSSDEYGSIMTRSTWKATIFFPINLANYVNNFLTKIYSSLKFMVNGVNFVEIRVSRQSKWIINDDGSRITNLPKESKSQEHSIKKQKDVLCHLMSHKGLKPTGDVVLHAQGGGLVVDARQVHEEYLRDWTGQLDGAVILNVIYSRLVRYPVALQEILDVYLWLISGDDSVVETLGFVPRRIICCGDSAGCYILFSMCLAARDIQLICPSEIPIYPTALVGISPILSSAVSNIFASFLLSYLDVFLSPSLLLHCFSLYSSGIIYDSECTNLDALPIDGENIPSHWLKDNYSETSSLKNFYNTWIKEDKSWFDCDSKTFENRITKMAERIVIPYISPIVSYDFNLVKDLNLYLISTDLDPFLDINIELAKIWKGELTFDVIEDMAHGFIAYYSLSNRAYEASKLCLKRLKEACSL